MRVTSSNLTLFLSFFFSAPTVCRHHHERRRRRLRFPPVPKIRSVEVPANSDLSVSSAADGERGSTYCLEPAG